MFAAAQEMFKTANKVTRALAGASSWASWRAPEVGPGGAGPGGAGLAAGAGRARGRPGRQGGAWAGGRGLGRAGAGPGWALCPPVPAQRAPPAPQKNPVPGAGRRDPDQAERAHGRPAQVGRLVQHHPCWWTRPEMNYATGQWTRFQEVQAHGQRVPRPPGAPALAPADASDPASPGRPGLVF